VMDSLRWWADEMHVDGFRFDLASALAREAGKVENLGGFFDAIRQDPALNRVKLIAEPWDLGLGGYQVGNFPPGWAEWNDRYRDGVRSFWKGDMGAVGDLAHRLAGSQDLYGWSGKGPTASINFITAHDGFTLNDLVSYNDKHNEANGEDNRDGSSNNVSWNHGVEGPTDDAAINALRERQKRNLLATLILSQGVPMILAGDERSHGQRGNNNVYCQDNELAWLDWTPSPERDSLRDFVAEVVAIRCAHPSFRRRSFFRGQPMLDGAPKDVVWLKPDGTEMTHADWHDGNARCLGMLVSGSGIIDVSTRGELLEDDDFLLLLNAYHGEIAFAAPARNDEPWTCLLDTAAAMPTPVLPSGETWPLAGRSLVLLRRPAARAANGTTAQLPFP